jgi:hypothetical protein
MYSGQARQVICSNNCGVRSVVFMMGCGVFAGATAWDMEDGDLSKHILSCPPSSCKLFNCPGHESFRKGLSGCGIDTVNAPVGTLFFLTFTVSDLAIPPATSEVVRLITVASPCREGQIYCPNLAKSALSTGEHACGTTECISRAAIVALEPMETFTEAVSVHFSAGLPLAAISNTSNISSSLSGSMQGRKATILSQVCCLFQIPQEPMHSVRSCASPRNDQCPVCSRFQRLNEHD